MPESSKTKCRWHRRRNAVAVGVQSKHGYCRECWAAKSRWLEEKIPYDAAVWLAA